MIEDQQLFYDNESESYSRKRYEGPLLTYVQYLFRKRLKLLLALLERIISGHKELTLFEIGCADGIILRKIDQTYPSTFTSCVGADVSAGMIAAAQSKNTRPNISFVLRGQESPARYDVVIELGVHVTHLNQEIEYVKSHVKENGYFIYSVASRKSIHARLKLKDKPYLHEYLTYSEAEKILSQHFSIVASVPYGLFIPKLWKIPFMGRLMQPCFDFIGSFFVPEFFHETIYLLKNK